MSRMRHVHSKAEQLMGLLDILKKAGHGIVQGVDNAAYNSLGGGLLGSAIPQPVGGLLGPTPMSNSTNDDGSPVDPSVQPSMSPVAPVSQQFKPNPAQTRNMRTQFLTSIGSALQQNHPLAEGLQNYQQGVVGQLQAGQAAQEAQAKKQELASFQQEMQAAAGNLQAQQQVLMRHAVALGPAETKAYQDVIHGMQPPKPERDDVEGAPFAATGPDGKLGMFLKTKSGKIIPTNMTPQRTLSTDGQGNIYDTHASGDPIVRAGEKKPPAAVQYDTVQTDQGIVRVPKTGENPTVQPLMGADGKPLRPFRVPRDTTASDMTALDRETTKFGKPYEKHVADASAQIDKIDEARSMINGNASAQALGIPKVLTAVVSGAGSGVRITQPELNALGHARGIQGDVQGFISKVSGQGTLTPIQQQQISGVLDGVKDLVSKKRAIANAALDQINGAHTREEIIAVDAATRKLLEGSAGAPPAAAQPGLPQVGQQFNGGKVLSIKRIN